MEKIKSFYERYKALFMYAIFGVLTTLLNLAAYYVLYEKLGYENLWSTAVAWLIAVVFSFVTNKKWVFDSQSMELKVVLYELLTFFGCRFATGIFDLSVMYIAVDVMKFDEMLWKLLSNVIVIVLNYIASKLVIFRKKDM